MFYSILPVNLQDFTSAESRECKSMQYKGHHVEYYEDLGGVKYITRLHATNLSAYLDTDLFPGSQIEI